jgi:3D (Asp-Asp-Asp) domain-containing protein
VTERGHLRLLIACTFGVIALTGALMLQDQPQGEGGRTRRPSVVTTPPVTPRATPTAASRSRTTLPKRRGTRTGQALKRKQQRATGSLTTVTAYCATGNPTASGKTPRPGMAAGNDWPFGTRLHVDGIGVVTIEDRYGSGTQLDLFMDSCTAARTFGRRHLRVEVLQ